MLAGKEKGRKEGKIGAKGGGGKGITFWKRGEGAAREHVYTLFVHIPLTIYIGVRAV